jgi:hypothetical protein
LIALAALAALVGCQPGPAPVADDPDCDPSEPLAGEVRVQPWCSDLELTDGEARNGDLWLGNSLIRVVFKHPLTALTVPGLGGGTVVDAAPWGYRDRAHELIPIVDDGWLIVDTMEVDEDAGRVTVSGVVGSLPDRAATAPGARRTVTWTLEPDSPWLGLEGADGLWIHPHGDFRLLDGQVVHDSLTYGHDGDAVEDLGGAVRISGVSRVLIAPTQEASAWLYPDGVEVQGTTSVDAERVALFADGVQIAQIGVDPEGVFAGRAPAAVDALRAEGPPFGPSATVPPGNDLVLPLASSGALELTLAFDGPRPRPARLTWADGQGQSGELSVPAGGGTVTLPAGALDLVVDAGPLSKPWTGHVELPGGASVPLAIELAGADAGDRMLAAVTWPVSRSRTWRGTDEDAARAAMLAGADLIVATPEDEVATTLLYAEDAPHLVARNGSMLTDPEAAWGGDSATRFVAVDLPFLELAGAPWEVDPDPDMLRLPAPGALGLAAWQTWYAWLDAQVDLVPVGPLTWVDVADPTLAGGVDVEAGLLRGRVCATTGPLVTLDVAGAAPGDLRLDDGTPVVGVVQVIDPRGLLDRVGLLGPGGELLAEAELVDGAPPLSVELTGAERWVAAVAWSTDGEQFAVTGPVWSSPAPADTGDTGETGAP